MRTCNACNTLLHHHRDFISPRHCQNSVTAILCCAWLCCTMSGKEKKRLHLSPLTWRGSLVIDQAAQVLHPATQTDRAQTETDQEAQDRAAPRQFADCWHRYHTGHQQPDGLNQALSAMGNGGQRQSADQTLQQHWHLQTRSVVRMVVNWQHGLRAQEVAVMSECTDSFARQRLLTAATWDKIRMLGMTGKRLLTCM